MELTEKIKNAYCEILKEELQLSLGCTEPIAISYAAALAGKVLGGVPEKMEIGLSGNVIKNVKSVVVPATGGLRGIEAALAAGIIAGCPEKELEVLTVLEESDIPKISAFLKECKMEVRELETEHVLDIRLTAYAENNEVMVRIADYHTNVVQIIKNGKAVQVKQGQAKSGERADRALLNVQDIVTFAKEVPLADVKEVLERQVQYNMAIAKEGLKGEYGACIGKITYGDGRIGTGQKARALAAAGSDARMNGCTLPVCILSGSGNQGITASVPIVVYAEALQKSREEMLRALVVSDLVTVHQKTGIGCLSAYCGAISAGCGCGAGIAFLNGGEYREIAHSIVNTVAILSGTICDGAKSSCAAKISMAVEAGILGYEMYRNGRQFYGGDGIVTKGVERTLHNVSRLAREGMRQTDREIIKIMLGKEEADCG